MGVIKDLGRIFLRTYKTDGLPASGFNPPAKSEGIATFDKIDELVSGIVGNQASGALAYATLNQLTTDGTDRIQYQKAEVFADPTPANNGVYQNTSAGPGNTWAKVLEAPTPNVIGSNTFPLA